jgi:hypothetical protein
MSMKTKDRRGKLPRKAGMSVKTKEIRLESGNVMCAPTARIASGWKSHPDSRR